MEHVRIIPAGLTRCPICGEYKGKVRAGDLNNKWLSADPKKLIGVICLCYGILCKRCGRNKIHRPISNEYDEATNKVWHIPYFGECIPCAECRKEEQATRIRQQNTAQSLPVARVNRLTLLL